MVSLIVPHLLFQGLVIWQRCFSGWRGNTWASFRPPAHLISTHISSLTPEFTMIHSKWIYFQRFIYNCVNKSVSRSEFWCLPFMWCSNRAQNKCALLVSLLQEKMSNSGEKLNLKQLAGRATQSSSYPLPLCGLMTLFCFCFVQIKACEMASWLMGEKKWLIAKKQRKIRKHTQNFKTFFFHFQRTSRESLSSIASAFYNQIFSLLHGAVPLRHLQQYVFIWRWRAQMLLDINIENTMLLTQSGVCALKLFTNVLDFSSISCMSPSSRVLQHCT